MKALEKIANVAVIVGFAVFIFAVFRADFAKGKVTPPSSTQKSLVGSQLTLPSLRLDPARTSLLIAISTKCHFCEQSLPFYKEVAFKGKERVDVIVVAPQSVEESTSLLNQEGVFPKAVVSADLNAIGVSGTPTLLLVNPQGKVQMEWMGKLNVEQEKQVLQTIVPGG